MDNNPFQAPVSPPPEGSVSAEDLAGMTSAERAKYGALRVRRIAPNTRYTKSGAETIVLADATFYYPRGEYFDRAEAATLRNASLGGFRLTDRCVSGVGVALTFVTPSTPHVHAPDPNHGVVAAWDVDAWLIRASCTCGARIARLTNSEGSTKWHAGESGAIDTAEKAARAAFDSRPRG